MADVVDTESAPPAANDDALRHITDELLRLREQWNLAGNVQRDAGSWLSLQIKRLGLTADAVLDANSRAVA